MALAVAGEVSQPSLRHPGYVPDNDGLARILPGMGGVVYNVSVGDPAFHLSADHAEPGVSVASSDEQRDFAMHYLTCIGNDAVVTTGLAKGARGIVTGEHARMLVHFDDDTHDLLAVGDTIQITTLGRGLQFTDYPDIVLKKCSPALIDAMPIEAIDDERIHVPVAIELPIRIMGSGAELNSEMVDQDLMSGDRELMRELGIDQMRLGDLIAIRHADHRFGRTYREGAVTIALCIHGDSIMTGHGPGILTLMTCERSAIEWTIDPNANIDDYLQIRAGARARRGNA